MKALVLAGGQGGRLRPITVLIFVTGLIIASLALLAGLIVRSRGSVA